VALIQRRLPDGAEPGPYIGSGDPHAWSGSNPMTVDENCANRHVPLEHRHSNHAPLILSSSQP
jgi:hypothetical protein